jgi:uncharacterized membrane protein YphA (DoxX/SURF4 family)
MWHPAKRALFRFAFCYFVLYSWPEGGRVDFLSILPGGEPVSNWLNKPLHAVVPWIATRIFHVTGEPATYFPTGSGDTTLQYITQLLYLVMALGAAALWSLLDRKRPNYIRLQFWFRILLRYLLAVTLFAYGFAKVFPLQFGPPGPAKLVEPYGEFSPMGVLWSFMGASVPYIIFSGACEVAGGLLVLFRRTTTLGALVSMTVMANVVALNFFYDVPVKLYSANILLMAVVLAAPDVARLFDFFVRNRPVAAADLVSFGFRQRWKRVGVVVVKVLFVGAALFSQIHGGWSAIKQRGTRPRPPLQGLYDVESFERNGVPAPAVPTAWRKVVIQAVTAIGVRTFDDTFLILNVTYDEAKSVITLDKKDSLTWSRPDASHVLLEGSMSGTPVRISLKAIDIEKLRLKSTGFHWINERPFNR